MGETGSLAPLVRIAGEERFARFERIRWWDQARLRRARILVVGAGALGNEVIKNLALLGVGRLAVCDLDRVEESNLSRSVLFRGEDAGRPKAECAAAAATSLYPDIHAIPLVGDVLADVGLGWFRWADAVVGALDNREARVFVNAACARLARPWFDGGIDVLDGVVRGFWPPATACYECTMSETDWQLLAERRSCSLLARRARAAGGEPTTPTSASVIGAIQAQEVTKLLHGRGALLGRGYFFEGESHGSYPIVYTRRPDCERHDPAPEVIASEDLSSASPLAAVAERVRSHLGGFDALDLDREIVASLACAPCGRTREVLRPVSRVDEDQARCPTCGGETAPSFVHSLPAGSPHLERTAGELGLPPWEIVWGRHGERVVGVELAGDRPAIAG